MKWVHQLVDRYTERGASIAYRECRHCGKTVDVSHRECPACRSREFATYAIS